MSENTDPVVSEDELKQIATDILTRSHSYFTEFVPAQMELVNGHIERVHTRLEGARDSGDYQRLTGALRSLHQTQSEMLERSTVVFMASYKPMIGLLESANNKTVQDAANSESDTASDDSDSNGGSSEDWQLNTDQLGEIYPPYEDEEN